MKVDLSYKRTYPLAKGYSIEFTLSDGHLEARWSPRCPKGKQATRKLVRAYRNARNHFIASLGVPALVVEL